MKTCSLIKLFQQQNRIETAGDSTLHTMVVINLIAVESSFLRFDDTTLFSIHRGCIKNMINFVTFIQTVNRIAGLGDLFL